MSLYHEAAKIIEDFSTGKAGSLKALVYHNPSLKSTPARLYALISETLKFQDVIGEVIINSGILKTERKLSQNLAFVLIHDHFLAKGGISLPANHPLKASIVKHKARLSAEFTRARIRRGFPTLEALIESVKVKSERTFPRWIRVNTLKITVSAVLEEMFSGFEQVETLEELINGKSQKLYYVDKHIPNLIALPPTYPTTVLTTHKLYHNGKIILQDKASCIPAALLAAPEGSVCIDACAAPGNKTTHLAAIVKNNATIFAFERDKKRSEVLQKMVNKAGAQVKVNHADFLATLKSSEEDPQIKEATHLLLDPSCSGSGIVSRVETELRPLELDATQIKGKEKKKPAVEPLEALEEPAAEESAPEKDRLEQLAAFQKRILEHALAFPNAVKVTYSTCSVNVQENEQVVLHALKSKVVKSRGWRILKREDQGLLQDWEERGWMEEFTKGGMSEQQAKEAAEACIRCDPAGKGGTIGFFVAGFVRDPTGGSSGDAEEVPEQEGGSNALDKPSLKRLAEEEEPASSENRKKKKKKKGKKGNKKE